MKFILSIVLVIFLTGCPYVNTPPPSEDTRIYFNGEDSLNNAPIDLFNESGEFRIYWNFTQKVDVSLYNAENNEYLNIFEGYQDNAINCAVDKSYLEIKCINDDGTTSSDYIDITNMYPEIPYTLYIIFNSYNYDGYVNSSYELLLK